MPDIGVNGNVLAAQIWNYVVLFVAIFVLIGLIVWFVIRRQRKNKNSTPVDIANDMNAERDATSKELQ